MPNDVWRFLRDPNEQRKIVNSLMDVANRGLVSGTLGAPVDMATQAANLLVAGGGYAGHKLGLLDQPPDLIDPQKVPGSSEWIGNKMQRAGLLGDYRNPIAELGVSMLSPVAAKGAMKAGGLLAQADLAGAANAAKVRAAGPIAKQRGGVKVTQENGDGMLYHVAPNDHTGDLLSLYKQHGDDAYQMYASRWPESGNLAQDHAHYVHLHDNLKDAQAFVSQRGGKVYAVDPATLADDWIDVIKDRLEYPHPMVRDSIPSEYLKQVSK